jgi:hypothetical protein
LYHKELTAVPGSAAVCEDLVSICKSSDHLCLGMTDYPAERITGVITEAKIDHVVKALRNILTEHQ